MENNILQVSLYIIAEFNHLYAIYVWIYLESTKKFALSAHFFLLDKLYFLSTF